MTDRFSLNFLFVLPSSPCAVEFRNARSLAAHLCGTYRHSILDFECDIHDGRAEQTPALVFLMTNHRKLKPETFVTRRAQTSKIHDRLL